MKYLLIFLISVNCLADIKVAVTTKEGKISCSDGCKFKTQLEADAWIADNISNDSWGKKERWEKHTNQTNCLEIVDVEFFGEVEYQNCKLPVEYTIEITDITTEVEAEEAKKAADKLREDEIKAKDKAMKLEELVELLQLKGLI